MAADPLEVDPAARGGIQRPVVSMLVDSPGALVGEVGRFGAVLDPQQA